MTKSQATIAGKRLLKKLRGDKWRLRVWENLGWHYAVETDRIAVYGPSYAGERCFSCLLKPHYAFFGDPSNSTDPNRAVRNTLKTANNRVNELSLLMAEAFSDAWL